MNTAKTILIIEDEKYVARLMQLHLEQMGYHVLCAFDGKQGIELFNNNKCDLVITDVIMPGKSGEQIISAIKASRPDVPIIVMSGNFSLHPGLNLDKNSVIKLGAALAIEKPVTREELLEAIAQVLG